MAKWIDLAGTLGESLKLGLNGVTIRSAPDSSPYTLTWPTNSGSPNQVLATDGNGNTGWITVTAGQVGYERTFIESDLSNAGILIVSHGLGVFPSSVRILNASGEEIYPDRIEDLSVTMLSLNLQSYRPLAGAFKVIIRG